jgi:hypothetical protein
MLEAGCQTQLADSITFRACRGFLSGSITDQSSDVAEDFGDSGGHRKFQRGIAACAYLLSYIARLGSESRVAFSRDPSSMETIFVCWRRFAVGERMPSFFAGG